MRNIVLTSCGIIKEDFKNRFYEIVSKEELKNKKVLYITTASDGDPDDDKSWMNIEFQTILDLGIDKTNIIEYKIGESNIDINDFDIMYMMGGNTFYLLDVIRKTYFDKEIVNFINSGKIYIGSSAGSEILGNSIEPAIGYDDNNVGMIDFTGLKIIDGLIIPHCNRKTDFVESLKNKTTEKLILLYDGDGIIKKLFINSNEKRENVKRDYDLIAEQYSNEFGVSLEDKDLIEKFQSQLKLGARVVDLGGGPGQVTKYLIDNGYDAVCYDFSKEMMKNALRLYPGLPYILDDIVNLKNHFSNDNIDGIVALYSLFHIPKEELKKLFRNINSVLKDNGIFLFSFQLGNEEKMVDEPYLKENGKDVLYMNYITKEEVHSLLKDADFEIIFEQEKREVGENVLGKDGNDAIYIIAKKK